MSLEEVRKVKRKYTNHLMSFKNVVSVGVGRTPTIDVNDFINIRKE